MLIEHWQALGDDDIPEDIVPDYPPNINVSTVNSPK